MSANGFSLDQREQAKAQLNSRRETEIRVCTDCGDAKLLKEFQGRIVNHLDYLQVSFRTICRKCTSPINTAKVKEAKAKDPIYARACAYWHRSAVMGIPSDLKLRDIRLSLTCPCYYCETRQSAMTLDRKDSTGGYTKNNTVPCCFRCNTLKSDMPLEAWEKVVPAVKNAAKLGLFGDWRSSWFRATDGVER
jgi:hypothetical protein